MSREKEFNITLNKALSNKINRHIAQAIYYYSIGYAKKALTILAPLAENGHSRAQYLSGVFHAYSLGIGDNYKKVHDWYYAVAMQGNPNAQVEIGCLYSRADCIQQQDYVKAVEFFKLAADQNYEVAQFNLAHHLFDGRGIEKNIAEAFKLWLLSAKQGYHFSQRDLGLCYYHGYGTNKDSDEAFKWLFKSAELGNLAAQNDLLYFSNYELFPKKFFNFKSFCWIRRAAYSGNVQAQILLSDFYLSGCGFMPSDPSESIKWAVNPAYAGYSCAQLLLVTAYILVENHKDALIWAQKVIQNQNNYSMISQVKYMLFILFVGLEIDKGITNNREFQKIWLDKKLCIFELSKSLDNTERNKEYIKLLNLLSNRIFANGNFESVYLLYADLEFSQELSKQLLNNMTSNYSICDINMEQEKFEVKEHCESIQEQLEINNHIMRESKREYNEVLISLILSIKISYAWSLPYELLQLIMDHFQHENLLDNRSTVTNIFNGGLSIDTKAKMKLQRIFDLDLEERTSSSFQAHSS